MVRHFVVEGDDGIRRWGHYIDDNNTDISRPQPYMPAGTMRSSLFGQWIAPDGGVIPAPTNRLPAAEFSATSWCSLPPPTPQKSSEVDWSRLNVAQPGVTHHKWDRAFPFLARPDVNRPATSLPGRSRNPFETPHNAPVWGAPGTFTPSSKLVARFDAASKVQVEMLSRTRYAARLTRSGGFGLTGVTGY
jgi:hypothetical protein